MWRGRSKGETGLSPVRMILENRTEQEEREGFVPFLKERDGMGRLIRSKV